MPTERPQEIKLLTTTTTQCKWMLRAAYVCISNPFSHNSLARCVHPPIPSLTYNDKFAQELLSTFGPALGEVALQPATGGVFTVTIETADTASSTGTSAPRLLWDRKTDGGFPETKELKRRVRDVIEPGRDLGHVDRNYGKGAAVATAAPTAKAEAAPAAAQAAPAVASDADTKDKEVPICEDC